MEITQTENLNQFYKMKEKYPICVLHVEYMKYLTKMFFIVDINFHVYDIHMYNQRKR